MGCGGSKTSDEEDQNKISCTMEKTGVASVDEAFCAAEPALSTLEHLRGEIMDNGDDLIINTGACCHKNPTMDKAVNYLLWKLSADNKGKFFDCGISVEEHKLVLSGSNNTQEAKDAVDAFNKFGPPLLELPEKLQEACSAMNEMKEKIMGDKDKYMEDVQSFIKGNPFKATSALGNFKKNCDNLLKACKIATTLQDKLKENINAVTETAQMVKDVEKIKKVDEVGEKAFKNKWCKPCDIVFNDIEPDCKYGKKAEDGYKLWCSKKDDKAKKKK